MPYSRPRPMERQPLTQYTELEYLVNCFGNIRSEWRHGKFYVVESFGDGEEVPIEITPKSVEEFVAVVREQLPVAPGANIR